MVENLSWDVEFDGTARRNGLIAVSFSFHRVGSTEQLPLTTPLLTAQLFVRAGTSPEEKAAAMVGQLRRVLGNVVEIDYTPGDDDFRLRVRDRPGAPVPDAIAIAGDSKVDINTDEDITIVKDAPRGPRPLLLTAYLLLEDMGEPRRGTVSLRLGDLYPRVQVDIEALNAAQAVQALVQQFNEAYRGLGFVAEPWYFGPRAALESAPGLSIEKVPCPLGLAAGVNGQGLASEMGLMTELGPKWGLRRFDQQQAPPAPGEQEVPPVINGEELQLACDARFVNGLLGNDCDPKAVAIPRRRKGRIDWFVFPGSRWEADEGLAVAELNRSITFYARYCILLSARRLRMAAVDARKSKAWYSDWFGRVQQAVGGAEHVGTTSLSSELIAEYLGAMADLQRVAQRGGAKMLVVFVNEYITDHRPTLVSGCQRRFQQIGIDWIDRESPFILAHELAHALGKSAPNTPGDVTWDHKSPCQNALTTIQRSDDSRQPIDLSGRYLEMSEFREIIDNKGGGVLN